MGKPITEEIATPTKAQMNKKGLLVFILSIVTFVPIILYPIVFGFHLTSDHGRWAEFGTFFSGVYTPILSLTTLLVLYSQNRTQREMNYYQIEQNTIHKVVNSNSQFLDTLRTSLDVPNHFGYTLEKLIRDDFTELSEQEYSHSNIKRRAFSLYDLDQKVFTCWNAINTGLSQLELSKGSGYSAAFWNEKLRIQSILTVDTCFALDNFCNIIQKRPQYEGTYFSQSRISTMEAES